MLESVWKLALKSLAGRSGGSSASWSLTPAARTRDGALRRRAGSAEPGSSVKAVPSPVTVNGTAAPSQASAKASAVVTGSEKVTRTLASSSTSVLAVGGIGRG